MEAVEEAQQRLVEHRIRTDGLVERGKLRLRWQLAMQQQITDFDEARMLCKLLDRVAAIDQHAFFAIDERDVALATARSTESRIVREHAELAVQRCDI
jgi:hypothetical protein